MKTSDQPISSVRWVDRGELSANDWNPNKQATPEQRLLRTSILENGWTQPIVTRDHGDRLEIVDGYHRWLVSDDSEIAALTGGQVPVVILPRTDEATARMATVRHNRARGVHHVLGMAAIVDSLMESGLTHDEIKRQLGMDSEEVSRLADRGNMLNRHAGSEMGNGWKVG